MNIEFKINITETELIQYTDVYNIYINNVIYPSTLIIGYTGIPYFETIKEILEGSNITKDAINSFLIESNIKEKEINKLQRKIKTEAKKRL